MELKFQNKGWRMPEGDTFLAAKLKKELHPMGRFDVDKVFIYGEGWKKVKNKTEVPVFKGDTVEEINKYIEKYGKRCAFYSLSGDTLETQDCCSWGIKQEFKVACELGFDYNSRIVCDVENLNNKIKHIVSEKYGVNWEKNYQTITNGRDVFIEDLFQVKIHYSLMAYFLVAPHIDPVSDDDKLFKHFTRLHFDASDLLHFDDIFPVSVRDRITFLFNKEVSDEYERIMKEYPLDYRKQTN